MDGRNDGMMMGGDFARLLLCARQVTPKYQVTLGRHVWVLPALPPLTPDDLPLKPDLSITLQAVITCRTTIRRTERLCYGEAAGLMANKPSSNGPGRHAKDGG